MDTMVVKYLIYGDYHRFIDNLYQLLSKKNVYGNYALPYLYVLIYYTYHPSVIFANIYETHRYTHMI